MNRIDHLNRFVMLTLFLILSITQLSVVVQTYGLNSSEASPMIILDESYVSDNRCDIGSTQTIGFHAKWSHNDSNVVNGIIYVEDEYGSFKKLSSGEIFYDTFSTSGGTETDETWHIGFSWYGGEYFEGGLWKIENGMFKSIRIEGDEHKASVFAYPQNVVVTDFIWEAKVMPMSINHEGPEVRFLAYSDNELVLTGVYDYYEAGHVLRLMISPPPHGSPHSTYETKSFTMTEGNWYTMKFSVEDSLVKCYLNGNLVLESVDPNVGSAPPRIILHCGYHINEWGYWDDVKIWKSNTITIENLRLGQKVELFDVTGNVKTSGTLQTIDTPLELDVSNLIFPFQGNFKVYSTDGISLLYATPIYDDIWGGDEYYASHRRELVTGESGWSNFTDSFSSIGIKRWDVVGVDCNGVTLYNQIAPSPSIIWDRVNCQLSSEEQRVDVKSSASIDVNGVYEYDGNSFEGSVQLSNKRFQKEIEKYTYMVDRISDSLYGLTQFTSNEIDIIFDRVTIELQVYDNRIDVGNSMSYSWISQYEYDQTPFRGQIILDYPLKIDQVGKYNFYVASILDQEYGLTSFDSNSMNCVWDRIKIVDGGVIKETARIGEMETVWFKAVYEYDVEEFTDQDGILYVNSVPLSWSSYDSQWKYSYTLEEPGSIVFEVTGVEDNKYGLTIIKDVVGPQIITWERPFWETSVGLMSIGGIIVVLTAAAIFFLRKRI